MVGIHIILNFMRKFQHFSILRFRKGCGGTFGTPFRNPILAQYPVKKNRPKSIPVELTTPKDVTGFGGTAEFTMIRTCKKSYCSGNIDFIFSR